MFVAIWRFTTNDPETFERHYGPAGTWAKFFASDADYIRTDLLKDGEVYITLDWWRSRDGYERFRTEQAADYGAIDTECEAFTTSEQKIGEFEQVQPSG